MIKVHHFASSTEAYDACQCDDEIKDGDVLVVSGEGLRGFLHDAWPIAVMAKDDDHAFHTLAEGVGYDNIGGRDYTASVEVIRDL